MTYALFLDDERLPEHVTWCNIPRVPYQVVRNFDEFCVSIETHGVPMYVTFDHDLADEHYCVMLRENTYTHNDGDITKTFDYGSERTGYDCAKWLVELCINQEKKFPDYDVHSMNPVGAERIRQYIEWAKTKYDFL